MKNNFLPKKTFILKFFLLICFANIFYSCGYKFNEILWRPNPVEERANSIKTLPQITALPTKYTVLVISDTHIGAENLKKNEKKPRRDAEFLAKIAAMTPRPQFCVALGDLVEHGYEEEYKNYDRILVKGLETLGIKTYNVLGNHDLYCSGWQHFKSYCYPHASFYKFQTTNFSWYALDSASGTLGEFQLQTMKNAFEKDPLPKIVMMHIPVHAGDRFYFVMQETNERNILISEFVKHNVKLVIDGHTHRNLKSNLGLFQEKNFPALYASSAFGLLFIDETNKTVKYETVYF
ncbi:MAG: metallophosphoesterase family protein [Treponemataceae bacterium]